MSLIEPIRQRRSHIWDRQSEDWYVEPAWCSRRLFEVEDFHGPIWDPACGMGRIVKSALLAGYEAYGTDIVQRGGANATTDFLAHAHPLAHNIVTNPPFDLARPFIARALQLAQNRVAAIFPTARLNAARWLEQTPLARIWFLTPRPSMPPGELVARGEKPTGGKMDFCWLVFSKSHEGRPTASWLHRDGQ